MARGEVDDNDLETSGWRDLDERLDRLPADRADIDRIIDGLTARLVGHFGVEVIDCFIGKNGVRRHPMREVAAAAIAHVEPALSDDLRTASGSFDDPTPPPWDDSWRTDPRTASWRS